VSDRQRKPGSLSPNRATGVKLADDDVATALQHID
jgi:hypothetical protein